MSAVGYEKLIFTIKSLIFTGFIVSAMGAMGVVLFAPELGDSTQSVSGYEYRHYPSLPPALVETTLNINWGRFANLDNVEHKVQGNAILRATPEGISFIVAYHLFRKVHDGGSVTIGNIADEIRDALPTGGPLPDFYPMS